MNKVCLTAQITKPISLTMVGNNMPFAVISLAVDDLVQNKQKEWETRTDEMTMEIWRSLARYAKEEFKVGDYVEVEACLRAKASGITVEIQQIKRAINS